MVPPFCLSSFHNRDVYGIGKQQMFIKVLYYWSQIAANKFKKNFNEFIELASYLSPFYAFVQPVKAWVNIKMNSHLPTYQCDWIGRFCKVLGDKFSFRSSPKLFNTYCGLI